MKLPALTSFFAVLGAANAHGLNPRHAHIHKRQDAVTTTDSVSTAATSTGSSTTGPFATLVATQSDVAPLSEISLGMPTGTFFQATTTVAAGYIPTLSALPGAPEIPGFVYTQGEWPPQDKAPPTDSDEVLEWLKELDGFDIPDLEPTVDGSCGSDPAFAQDAESRGWWTCGGFTRDTDIIHCPDKLDWGVSFDDGPGPYTPKLLTYLDEKDISATFFVVGSRVIERPDMVVQEYLFGHEISVHTWSHTHLTQQTNEQIVAELGWTRKAIKEVLGVTPTTMRPPYGDIDDRVRAIALAMGLIPIIWTRTPEATFDTNDWAVAGGLVNGEQCVEKFEAILSNASSLDTGFIVLEHDLYEITVDLAIGYNLERALSHDPAFSLKPIGECAKIPTTDLYRETNTNESFPFASRSDVDGDGSTDSDASRATKDEVDGAMSLRGPVFLLAFSAFFTLL